MNHALSRLRPLRVGRCVSVLALTASAAVAGCSGGGGGGGGGGGEEDAAADAAGEAGGDASADGLPDTSTDVPPDVAPDSAPDVAPDSIGEDTPGDIAPPECDERERAVGGECLSVYNRLCTQDSECRTEQGETCASIDADGFGTCTYVPFDPIQCPGGPTCAGGGEAELRAGFAARTITPMGWEPPRAEFIEDNGYEFIGDVRDPSTFCDCGRDMICPPGDEYEDCPSMGAYAGPDADGTEGDEQMQGAWIAGFDHSRTATLCGEEFLEPECEGPECCVSPFAHDDVWARGVVLDQGDSRIAMFTVDTVGFFYDDARRIEARLPAEWGIDWLLISATHTHEAMDTMGQWGPGTAGSDLPDITGVVPSYMEYLYGQVVAAIGEAVENLEAVDVYASEGHTGGITTALNDSRDPFIANDLVAVVQFVRDGEPRDAEGATLGTLVNWHSHPEAAWSDNTHISSDFAHYVRKYVEEGLSEIPGEGSGDAGLEAIEGLGGIAVYVSGSVGGLLTPGHWPATARDGSVHDDENFARADAIGQRVAESALLALRAEGARVEDESLSFATREFLAEVQNRQFHTAIFGLDLFDRGVYNWRGSDGLFGPNFPKIRTGVTSVRVGDVTFQSFPGELFSEFLTGGFNPATAVKGPIVGDPTDLRCAADLLPPEGDEPTGFPCLVRPDNPNPPDLSAAPEDGYLYAELPGRVHFAYGLGNDEIGYLVPLYDFELGSVPYLLEAEGDHYEETNSVGPVAGPMMEEIRALYE